MLFDDENVTPISADKIVDEEAYVLFYQRRAKTVESMMEVSSVEQPFAKAKM